MIPPQCTTGLGIIVEAEKDRGPVGALLMQPYLAPMILDERGIARVGRWADDTDLPRWDLVAELVVRLGVDRAAATALFGELQEVVGALPAVMRDGGVPAEVIDRCADRIRRVTGALALVAP